LIFAYQLMDILVNRMGTALSTDRLMPALYYTSKKGLEGKMTETKAEKGFMLGLEL